MSEFDACGEWPACDFDGVVIDDSVVPVDAYREAEAASVVAEQQLFKLRASVKRVLEVLDETNEDGSLSESMRMEAVSILRNGLE